MPIPFTRAKPRSPANAHAHSLVLSYLAIRRSLGLLGFILPIILGPIGWLFFGIEIQENMSSYYHTPLRDVFVGVMCSIGIFLYCYRGYDATEHWTGIFACLAAVGVAIFPLDPHSDPLRQSTVSGYLHTMSGGTFFSMLALYSLYHFPRGNLSFGIVSRDEKRDAIYRTSGLTIVGCMGVMGIHLFLLTGSWKATLNDYNFLFWMEWVAVWAFAFAWLTKGHAILANVSEEIED